MSKSTETTLDVKALFAPVPLAIQARMPALLITGADIGEAFRTLFMAAYDATATAFLTLFPPANEGRFLLDHRVEIPLEALQQLESALERETLVSGNFLPCFKTAIRLAHRRIGGKLPTLSAGRDAESLEVFLSNVLYDQVVRSACARRWVEPEPIDATKEELATARKERCEQFKFDMAARIERKVTHKAIAFSAGVYEPDLRKYLRGLHESKSVLTQRIEDVLDGKTELIFPPEKRRALSRHVRTNAS